MAKKVRIKNKNISPELLEYSPHPTIHALNIATIISLLLMLAGVTVAFTIITQNIVMIKPFLNFQLTYFAFVLFIVASYIRGKFVLEYSPPFVPLIMFLLWSTVTFALTYFKYAAMEEINRFYSYGIMAILIVQVFSSKKYIKWAIYTYVGLIIASVVYVTMQDLGKDFVNWGMKVHVSFFGNPNFYSGYITTTVGILYSLYLYFLTSDYAHNLLKSKSKEGPILFTLIFLFAVPLLLLYVLATITARAAFIGAIVGIIFTIIVFIITGRSKDVKETFVNFRKNKYALYTFIFGILFVFLLLVVVYFVNVDFRDSVNSKVMRFKDRARSVFQTKYGTNKSRLIFYWGAMRMVEHMPSYPFGFDDLRDYQTRGLIKIQPLVGYGVGSFQKAFPFHRPPFYHHWGVSHNTLHVHDEYIEVLAETGLIGLAFFIFYLYVFFKYVFKNIKKIEDRFLQIIQIGLLAGVVGALAHNLYTVNLRWTSSAVQFWFITGLILAITKVAVEKKRVLFVLDEAARKKHVSKDDLVVGLLIGGIIAYIFMSVANIYTFKADMNLKRLEMFIGSRMWNQAKVAGKKAVNYNPYSLSAWYKLGYVYLNQNELNSAYYCYANILRLAPRYAQIHYNLGLLEQQRQNIYKSLDEFKLAGTIENNVVNFMRIANLYLTIEKYMPAILYFRKAIDIEPYIGTRDEEYKKIGYEQLAKLYLSLNMEENALRLLKIMAYKGIKKEWALKVLIEKMAAKGYYDNAILYLEDLKKLAPNDLNVYYSLANLYMTKKDFNKAFINYNNVLRLMNMNPVGEEKNILNKIIDFYIKLYKGNKTNAQIADILGVAYLKAGDYKMAEKYFKRALKVNPDFKLAKDHLEYLKRVGK